MLGIKEKNVLELIGRDISYSNYFFSKVDDIKWFFPLKAMSFFSPEKIHKSEKGDFLFWNILDYLERISKKKENQAQFGKELIEIIDNIVQFSLNKNRINNHHIWWMCIKILNNIPFNIINENINVDKIRSWFEVFTEHCPGSNFLIQDIGEKLLPKFLEDGAKINEKYEYAETIVDFLTELKRGKDKIGIRKKRVAVFRWDSYWIDKSLLKHSKLIGHKCSETLILNLLKKLKNAIEFKCSEHKTNFEIDDEIFNISVSRIPVDNDNPEEICFINNEYQCLFSKFSKEQLKEKDKNDVYWDD